MQRNGRPSCVDGIVKTLAKAGIAAVFDDNVGGFLLLKEASCAEEELWERALSAPVLILSDDELASPHCNEIAWRKATHMLQQPSQDSPQP